MGMPDTPAKVNQLQYLDDNVLRIFEISNAKCGVHVEDGDNFLSFACSTSSQLWPELSVDWQPFIEINIPTEKDSMKQVAPGSVIHPEDYHDRFGNLTQFFRGIFDDLENGSIAIHKLTDGHVDATITGKDGQLRLRGHFTTSNDMSRSFS